MTREIKTVAIVGTGVIGASWAAFYAGHGYSVRLHDISTEDCEKGLRRAHAFVDDLGRETLIEPLAARSAHDRMAACAVLEQALEGVDMVQESTAESYAVKIPLFTRMDALLPADVVLASSSSGLLMTRVQEKTAYPGRCLIAHPFNPPHLIPLVEIVPGEKTAPEFLDGMKAFLQSLGKTPIVLKKEVPGHIANRLAAALWREAIDIVLQGIASVEDVDKAVCAGPGLRWALMGQHMIYHLGGGQGGLAHFVDHLGPAVESWLEDMATWNRLPPKTKDILVAGVESAMGGRNIDELMQWRDKKLIGILKLLDSRRV